MNKYATFSYLNHAENRDFIKTCDPFEVDVVTELHKHKDHRAAADTMGVSRTRFVKSLDNMSRRLVEWRRIRHERIRNQTPPSLKGPSKIVFLTGRRLFSRRIYEMSHGDEFTVSELLSSVRHPLIRKCYAVSAISMAKVNGRVTSDEKAKRLVNSRWVAVYTRTDTQPPRGFK